MYLYIYKVKASSDRIKRLYKLKVLLYFDNPEFLKANTSHFRLCVCCVLISCYLCQIILTMGQGFFLHVFNLTPHTSRRLKQSWYEKWWRNDFMIRLYFSLRPQMTSHVRRTPCSLAGTSWRQDTHCTGVPPWLWSPPAAESTASCLTQLVLDSRKRHKQILFCI